ALSVAHLPTLTLDDEPEVNEHTPCLVIPAEPLEHLIPRIRCIADAKLLYRPPIKPPSRDVLLRSFVTGDIFYVEPCNASHHVIQRLVNSSLAVRAVGSLTRYIDAQAGRELFHCLGEGHMVVLHEEAQHGAVRSTPEAMVELLLRTHPERG